MGNRTDRKTLKGYFQTGKIPTEEHFAELIDSCHNILDDGQVHPVIIYPRESAGVLAKIYREKPGGGESDAVCWSLSIDSDKNLILANEQEEKVLSITQEKHISFFDKTPAKGANAELAISVPSDGQWHNLPIETDGCSACRIVVCYEYAKTKKQKVTEVIVSQCYGRRLKISGSKKFCGCHFGKILFRWNKTEGKRHLEARCRLPKIELSRFECKITKLWDFSKTE